MGTKPWVSSESALLVPDVEVEVSDVAVDVSPGSVEFVSDRDPRWPTREAEQHDGDDRQFAVHDELSYGGKMHTPTCS